jgi:hypothetical protein
MRVWSLLILIGLLVVPAASAATFPFSFEFNGDCPPDQQVTLQCFDLTGVLYISSSMQIGEKKTFNVDSSVQNLICVVICKGKTVYKKRFDMPGTPWRAPADYPWDIARLDDLPAGTPVSSSTSVVIRNPDNCGNGEDDPGEGCDTGGNLGCDDPHKPVCYDCLYCGCGSDNDCPWVSGMRNCGDAGCPPYSRPVYGRECALGVCINPVRCEVDQECIDRYQAEKHEIVPTPAIPKAPSAAGERAYDDPVQNTILYYERFGPTEEPPEVPVDFCPGCMQMGGLDSGAEPNDHAFPPGTVHVEFDGDRIASDGISAEAGLGAEIALAGGTRIVVTDLVPAADGKPAHVSYIVTNLTDRQILDALYALEEPSECDPLVIARLMGADLGSMEEEGKIDPALAVLIGDAAMNIYVDSCVSHITTVGGVVTEMGEGELGANTVNVYTDQATMDEMEAGELGFLDAYDAKRVRIEGEGFVEGLKFAIAEFLYNLGKIFG